MSFCRARSATGSTSASRFDTHVGSSRRNGSANGTLSGSRSRIVSMMLPAPPRTRRISRAGRCLPAARRRRSARPCRPEGRLLPPDASAAGSAVCRVRAPAACRTFRRRIVRSRPGTRSLPAPKVRPAELLRHRSSAGIRRTACSRAGRCAPCPGNAPRRSSAAAGRRGRAPCAAGTAADRRVRHW